MVKQNKLNSKVTNSKKTQALPKTQKSEPVTGSDLFPKLDTAFKALLSARFCAAIWSHITDCDETFNYWEPLHYLMYGKGLQTWEYSPEFALRSYTYLLLHGVPAWIYNQIFHPNPMLVFYFIRCMLGLLGAIVEVYFYKAVCREFGVNIGRMWLIFQLFSAGMFISSTALLPSSFSMYLASASLTAWWFQKYKLAIFFTAISTFLGWPFAAVLGIPIAYDILARKRMYKLFVIWAIISAATIGIPMTIIDTIYFGKLTVAPLNIVLYNVFTSHGPNLYGVEPLSYYFINGFLNFNIIWIFSLLAPFMLIASYFLLPAKSKSTLHLPHYLSLAPFYLWLLIFFVQPHKEERFLFPVYPMISLCAAISVDVVQKLFFRLKSWYYKLPTGTHYLNHSMFIVATVMILSTVIGLSRIFSLYRNYHAPLDLMMELNQPLEVNKSNNKNNYDINVCIGKDWYRFPNSFFFPNKQFRVRFLKSEFTGILPAYFSETKNGTQIVQTYFNDMNQENEAMYFNYTKCHYLLDLDLNGKQTQLEPNYASQTKDWEIVKSLPFINANESNKFFRAFYLPILSDNYNNYGNFNLLKRMKNKI